MSVALKLVKNITIEHKDEMDIEYKHWVTRTPFVKYFKQTFIFENKIISDHPVMMYMSFPGFVTIEPVIHDDETAPSDEEIYNQGLRYFKHEFDMVSANGIKKQHLRLTDEDKLRRIGKETRRMLKTWGIVLNSIGEDFYQKDKCNYKVILKDKDVIVNLDNRSDLYFPMCFKEKDAIIGGLYATAWETKPNLNDVGAMKEFDYFTTGGCLFGNEVYGIDDLGKCHPLTNPRYEMKNIGIIQKIEYISDKHSDEIITVETFKNLIPLIKTLSATNRPKVNYHIPECEYILNCIHHYINNRITTKACLDYIELISIKRRDNMIALHKICSEHNIDITFETPLDCLMNAFKEHDDVIQGILRITKIPILNVFENEKLVFDQILQYLCLNSGKYNSLWLKIKEQLENKKEEKEEEAPITLAKLSHISYCANIISPRLKDPNAKICSLYPGHEKRIQLTYKHLLNETYGNVYCINWLPPLLIKSEAHHNGVFFINQKLNKRVKGLLDLNVANHVFKSIGGVAADDREFVMQEMEEIFLILCSMHPRKLIEKIFKSLIK